jgi:hypothetical protein
VGPRATRPPGRGARRTRGAAAIQTIKRQVRLPLSISALQRRATSCCRQLAKWSRTSATRSGKSRTEWNIFDCR